MSYVVIGGGVNGLACAVELARSGKKVTLLEQRAELGGLSGPRTFGDAFVAPGIRHDTCEIRPGFADGLGLAAHGLVLRTEEQPVFASDKEAGLVLHTSADASKEEIGKRSPKDAESYAQLRGLFGALRPVLEPLLDRPPPPLVPTGFGEIFEMGLMGLKLRGLGQRDMTEVLRAAPMCVADWMRELFETELLSATLALPAVQGDFVGPWSPGTAAMLMLREAMIHNGVKGGPAAVVSALTKAFASHNGTVRTNAKVTRVRVVKGAVKAVVLASGDEIAADVVVAASHPRTALMDLLPPAALEVRDRNAARTIRSRGTVAKVHLGLAEAVSWRGRPGKAFARIRAGGAHLDDLERAFDATKYRELPPRPVLDIADIAAGGDGGEAGANKPVLSILVTAVPYDLDGGWSPAAKEKLLDSVLTVLEEHAPGVRGLVRASEVLTPLDLETEYGAAGGSIHHVERALDQMVLMRPARPFARYATPVEGFFVGSSGAHPGPGITLAPGVLAARAALSR